MRKFTKIILYIPYFFFRMLENIGFYFQNEKMYRDIRIRSFDESLYPIDFSAWVQNGHYDNQDANGIPIKNHIDGHFYSWSRICNYALYNFNEYKITGKVQYLKKFNTLASFIEENLIFDEEKNVCFLYHEYDWLELKRPWVGALVQGLIASVMMRYYLISNDEKYRLISEMASNMFFLLVEDGGVVKKINERDEWLEEYPIIKDSKYSFVLNGFMIALLGLYETSKISQSNKYVERYNELARSLAKNLDLFLVERSTWSVYSNPQYGSNHVTPAYQSLHIVLLSFHGKVSNLSTLQEVCSVWERSFSNKILRTKSLLKKIYYWINNPNTV